MNAKALLSPEQKENLVFKEMGREKNFAVVDDLKADFVFPKQKITVLFLALSFHEEHPHHIEGKITSLSKEDTNTKIVLLLLDKADTLNYVSEIQFQLIPYKFKLFLVWSYPEMADFFWKIIEKQ